jgi:serine/threonine protein kinase
MPSRFDNEILKQQYVDEILLNFHHLLMGLKLFKDNGVVHRDIKPQNIVYNPETKKMMYIDFGLTTTKDNIIQESVENIFESDTQMLSIIQLLIIVNL